MKKCLLFLLLCLTLLALASTFTWAEPFASTKGPIMEVREARSVIVVNEIRILVESSTPITDPKGRALDFHYLKRGQWVSVELEPGEDSGMVAKRITILPKD